MSRLPLTIAFLAFACAVPAEPTYFDREFDRARRAILASQDHPRSVAQAYRCFGLRDRVSDPEGLDRLFASIDQSPLACDILKGHAQWFLASLELDRGEQRRAVSRLRDLGFVFDWWIIGPFDNEGKGGFDQAYPPEAKIELGASYQGKERNVTWRPFPPINTYAYQDLSAALRPNLQVCAYAVAGLLSDREGPAAIRLGSDDAVRVWLNGQPVLENPAYRPPAFDQDVAGCVLRKGLNFILVKVCQKDGGWGFRLRLTTPSGGRLSGVRAVPAERLRGRDFEPAPAKLGRPEVASALADLQDHADQHPDSAEARRLLGYLLQMAHPHDAGEQAHIAEYEKALGLDPKDVATLLRLAEATPDHNKQRAYYQMALEARPDHAPALYGLAAYYNGRGDKVRQMDLLRKALDADPGFYPAALVLAYEYVFLPIRGLARAELQPIKARFPDLAWVDYQAAVITEALGDRDESAAAYARYLRTHWTNNAVRRYLLDYALGRKDLRGSLKIYREMLSAQPERLDLRRERATLLANNGRLDEALHELRAVLAICPEDASALQFLGDFQFRKGRPDAATASWRKSLAVHPQNPSLREYLEFTATEADAFETPFLADAAVLAGQEIAPERYAQDSAVYLAFNVVEKLHPNGTTSQFTQKIIRVLNETGVQQQRYHRVYYTAGRQRAAIESYRVIRKDGLELTSGEVDERRVVSGEHNTFYDYRVKRLRLPQLEAGDVIELRYRVSDVATRNYFGDHFGHIEVFREKLPAQTKRYVLIAPTDRKLFYHQEKMAPPEVRDGEPRVTIWSLRDVPGLPNEPMRPPLTTFAPYLHVSSFRDWDEVARYYANMIQDQFQIDAAVRSEIQAIVRGLKDDRQKIQALYHYLSRKTRYVGLEFGIHGYLPYPAYQVFARKYGDCKDKALLLTSMLRAVGVEAQVALVRTRIRGELHPEPASLSAFDHAICYVPKYDLWLDCTTEFNGTQELPDMDRGALALLIGPNEEHALRRPPLSKPADNLLSLDLKGTLSADGQFKATGIEKVTGSHCPQFRNTYKQTARQRVVFEGMLRGFHPTARAPKVTFSDLSDFEKPIDIKFELVVPLCAKARKGELLFAPTMFPQRLARRYAALSKRELPLNIYVPWSREIRLRIELPEQAEILHLPESTRETTRFGEFVFEAKREGNAITVREYVAFNGVLVPPEEYPAFRDFLMKIDDKLSESARVRVPEPKAKQEKQEKKGP